MLQPSLLYLNKCMFKNTKECVSPFLPPPSVTHAYTHTALPKDTLDLPSPPLLPDLLLKYNVVVYNIDKKYLVAWIDVLYKPIKITLNQVWIVWTTAPNLLILPPLFSIHYCEIFQWVYCIVIAAAYPYHMLACVTSKKWLMYFEGKMPFLLKLAMKTLILCSAPLYLNIFQLINVCDGFNRDTSHICTVSLKQHASAYYL